MKNDSHQQRILILDFGSQYSQVIARRVREAGVYCEMRSYQCSEEEIRAFAPQGIILSGGPETVTQENTPRAPECVFTLGCPVLGICYGMQTMAAQLGGRVAAASGRREFGSAQVRVESPTVFLKDIQDNINDQGERTIQVWMSHGDHVDQLPTNFEVIASSPSCPIAAMGDESRHFYGVQFHPEVTHTPQGQHIIERFVLDICGCEALWHSAQIIEESVEKLRAQIGNEKVLLGLSGGVDSTVAAVLLHKAIGDNLICVFVDTGLLRQDEATHVMQTMEKELGIKIVKADAKEHFYKALAGISDPEEKRKVIGRCFVEVFEKEAQSLEKLYSQQSDFQLGDELRATGVDIESMRIASNDGNNAENSSAKSIKWLAQGTIYSDVIESAANSGASHVIKSHHNVGGLPEKMKLKLVEPLRELFKDEVRKLGLTLGIAYENLYRHPFPGPGLGVRILGEIKPEYVSILQKADAIFMEELRNADLYYSVSQAFAVFLPVRSVAVMGDARVYEYVIALRAVETTDFMTAHWARLPYDVIEKISNRICNEVRHVSRVVYDVSSKPPATIEWE